MRFVFNISDPFERIHTQHTLGATHTLRHTFLPSFLKQNLLLLPRATLARNEFLKNDP